MKQLCTYSQRYKPDFLALNSIHFASFKVKNSIEKLSTSFFQKIKKAMFFVCFSSSLFQSFAGWVNVAILFTRSTRNGQFKKILQRYNDRAPPQPPQHNNHNCNFEIKTDEFILASTKFASSRMREMKTKGKSRYFVDLLSAAYYFSKCE